MEYFDAFLPIGRTNSADRSSPTDTDAALAVMDRFGVSEALVYHTVARDSDPELGNAQLANVKHRRLHKIWAFDPAYVIPESPEKYLRRALKENIRAILVNPLTRNVRLDHSPRILELAHLLEKRRIPLLTVHRQWCCAEDSIDWYRLADFCNRFPMLPVVAWEFRSRSNRPMFDALATTKNLFISLSSVWQAQMLETVCKTFGPRLVFSLGLPTLDPTSFIGVISYAPLKTKDKLAVAYKNMADMIKEARHE